MMARTLLRFGVALSEFLPGRHARARPGHRSQRGNWLELGALRACNDPRVKPRIKSGDEDDDQGANLPFNNLNLMPIRSSRALTLKGRNMTVAGGAEIRSPQSP